MLNNLLQMHLKLLLKEAIQNRVKATGDLIGNKIPDRIMKVSKTLRQNSSETVKIENDKEISKERYISPEERHKIIEGLRLI